MFLALLAGLRQSDGSHHDNHVLRATAWDAAAGEHYEYCDDLLHFRAHGFAVLLLNYRGVGESPGPCTRNGAVIDVATALAYLQHGCSIPPNRVIVFGHSIGGGYSAEAAREFAGCLVVNDRSFGTLSGVAQDHVGRMFGADRAAARGSWKAKAFRRGVRALVRAVACWELDSEGHFREFAAQGRPRIILHSRQDRVIPQPYQLHVALLNASARGRATSGSEDDGGSDEGAGARVAHSAGAARGGRVAVGGGSVAGCVMELTPEQAVRNSRGDAHNRALTPEEKRRLLDLVALFLAGQPLPPEA
jgi:pimeloyl-ACP methyl ester carboxylesterase